jgi:hypothetical protein
MSKMTKGTAQWSDAQRFQFVDVSPETVDSESFDFSWNLSKGTYGCMLLLNFDSESVGFSISSKPYVRAPYDFIAAN